MKAGIAIGAANSGGQRDWYNLVQYVMEAEKMGVEYTWSAEAWGQDAVVPLAYLAAKTSTMKLGSGIMQISARTPSMTAMTALTMATVSDDRFILGLGASGPQVVEGLQGVPFKRPLTRMRENIDIIRMAFRGEKIAYQGKHYTLPLPGGEGKALRLSQPGNDNIPIYLATLSPKSLELTGEVADGWLGTSFTPEGADIVFDHIRAGAEKAGRSLSDIDLQVGGSVAISDDVDQLIKSRKTGLAFQLGAMGSAQHNFYNDAFKRQGFAEVALEVQKLWISGKRDKAADTVPDELVTRTNLLGTEDMVKDRMRAYKQAGITTLRLDPQGNTLDERLECLGRAMDLLRAVNEE
jgi:F420-dependent oxidoreductase-like protein